MSSTVTDPWDRLASAYHEAGHVVASLCVGSPFKFARIFLARKGWEGEIFAGLTEAEFATAWPDIVPVRAMLAEANAIISLAGPLAEKMYFDSRELPLGIPYENSRIGDIEESATDVIKLIDASDRAAVYRLIESQTPNVYAMLTEWWPVVDAIAAALLTTGHVSSRKCREIANQRGLSSLRWPAGLTGLRIAA